MRMIFISSVVGIVFSLTMSACKAIVSQAVRNFPEAYVAEDDQFTFSGKKNFQWSDNNGSGSGKYKIKNDSVTFYFEDVKSKSSDKNATKYKSNQKVTFSIKKLANKIYLNGKPYTWKNIPIS